jgi:Soluble lytic murein transglycosylase and related regulatory proteins (some contain LysM/invasin domains)
MKKTLILAALLCLQTAAFAVGPEPPAPLVEAIARQESGQNPLAINIAGKSFYPATREEAEQLIQKAVAAGQSFDVGILQVNSWWIKKFDIDPVSLLDPATNEEWGKRILAGEIARHGLNWKAVGKYHSPDPERGRQYAWLVYRHYQGGQDNGKQGDSQNVSDSRGIRTDQGIGQQSGPVPVHVQQKGMPWVFRPKSGTAGSPD